MKTENDCRWDKRIDQLEEALRNIANGDMRTSKAKAKMALEGTFPPKRGGMQVSDTPRTDKLARGNHVVPTEWAEDLERECKQRKADWNKACDERGFLMLECDGHRAKAAKLRTALQTVMDWNPKLEYWERPETVARFEADMARARKVLEETQPTPNK